MKILSGFVLLMIIASFDIQDDFLKDQKRYPRVRSAISEKQTVIEQHLEKSGLTIDNYHVLMVAYKEEDELVLYVKGIDEDSYERISKFEICSKSGSLGPKRRQGDHQVPEGFYHIDRFNPASSFHLSVGLNYPNLADRRKSTFDRMGGDIFIHGACVTIGCLPMTHDKIKEIYLYAIHARNNGQLQIPVYVFPFRMTDVNMSSYAEKYKDNQDLLDFWTNLKVGHDQFHQNKQEVSFSVTANGDYQFETD